MVMKVMKVLKDKLFFKGYETNEVLIVPTFVPTLTHRQTQTQSHTYIHIHRTFC